jgi:aryl-alcohol dehydrogenase-like predicted oxidoreductase
METRTLGRTGLEISTVGFGAWAIGGERNATGGWGPVDDAESVAAIHAALEHGVTWIDTAPGYGSGHSEDIVGKAISGLAEPPRVFTKCGFVWDDEYNLTVDITPDSIRREADASLRRLGVEAIDLFQIHWVEPENDPEIEAAWQTLADLKAAGKVLHIGVSNFTTSQLDRCEAIAPVETLQPPYSLLDRGVEAELFPYTERADIGVIVYSPMQSGLLTGRMSRERVEALPSNDVRLYDPNFLEPLLTRNLAVVEQLREIAAAHGLTPAQAAIAWVLANPAVDGAIVGFRKPAQVSEILGGTELTLGSGVAAELSQLVAGA